MDRKEAWVRVLQTFAFPGGGNTHPTGAHAVVDATRRDAKIDSNSVFQIIAECHVVIMQGLAGNGIVVSNASSVVEEILPKVPLAFDLLPNDNVISRSLNY